MFKNNIFKKELLYKLFSYMIILPIILFILELLFRINNYNYISFNIINSLYNNYLTYIFLFIISIILNIFLLTDISMSLIFITNKNNKYKLSDALYTSLLSIKKLFKKNNILYIIYSNIICYLVLLLSIYICKNIFISLIIFGILYFLIFKFIYIYLYYYLNNMSFNDSIKYSISLSNIKYSFKDSILLVIYNIIYFIIGLLVLYLLFKLFIYLNSVSIYNLRVFLKAFIVVIGILFVFIFNSYLIPLNINYIYNKFKLYSKNKLDSVNSIIIINNKNNILLYIFIIIFIIIDIISIYMIYSNNLVIFNNYNYNGIITAHRGASKYRPENSMEAFIYAHELQTDAIELDIQETKDQVIYVMHDNSLLRTANINSYSYEVKWNDIKDANICYNMCDTYNYVHIPTLDEVISYAKDNNINLNIELKPTGKEINFVKNTIDIINKYNYKDNIVLTSQTYDILKEIKDHDNSIKTVYVTSKLDKDISYYIYADDFSLKYSIINDNIVNYVHNKGNKVYAWTIDDPFIIKNMIKLNVDNIITNDIINTKKYISYINGNIFIKLYEYIIS